MTFFVVLGYSIDRFHNRPGFVEQYGPTTDAYHWAKDQLYAAEDEFPDVFWAIFEEDDESASIVELWGR